MIFFLLIIYAICIPGGYSSCKEDSEKKGAVADFAIETMNENEDRNFELVSIDKCEQQVVRGANYKMEITVKEDEEESQRRILVYESLEGEMTLYEAEEKVSFVGGWNSCADKITEEDEDFFMLVGEVMEEINKQSNSMYSFTLYNIIDCKQQVVAGMKYELEMVLAGSPNGETEQHTVQVFKALDGTLSVELLN